MAHLSERDRRGQILLVTGFALAVAFVGLAVILNSVIFTENLATRSESTTTTDAITHANTVEDGTAAVISYINEYNATNATDYDGIEQNLTRAFRNISTGTTYHQLNDGQVTNDTLLGYDQGTRIRQPVQRNFTSPESTGFQEDYELVDDANGASEVRIHVTDPTTLGDGGANPFELQIQNDATDQWTINVSRDPGAFGFIGTDYFVGIETPSGDSYLCEAVNSGDFWVNVSAGTVAGNPCPELRVAQDLTAAEEIDFDNAENIEGTYRMLLNGSRPTITSIPYGPGTGQPYVEPVIYAADVRIDYGSSVLTYKTDLRITPGDGDA